MFHQIKWLTVKHSRIQLICNIRKLQKLSICIVWICFGYFCNIWMKNGAVFLIVDKHHWVWVIDIASFRCPKLFYDDNHCRICDFHEFKTNKETINSNDNILLKISHHEMIIIQSFVFCGVILGSINFIGSNSNRTRSIKFKSSNEVSCRSNPYP